MGVALFALGTMGAHRPLFDPSGTGGERSDARCRSCEATERLERALDALDQRVERWRREREGGPSSTSPDSPPSPPPATTVVEKYAARVRAKLEAAARAS